MGRTKCFLDSHEGPLDLRKCEPRVDETQRDLNATVTVPWLEFEYPCIVCAKTMKATHDNIPLSGF